MRPVPLPLPLIAVMLIASVMLAGAPPALADADPASDVLLTANVFYPYNPPVSTRLQTTFNAETEAAHKRHFPIKVALIATPVDLGAIPQLFDKPQQYAAFLDQEISFSGKVPVLVVMPDGYGSSGLSNAASATLASLGRPRASAGNALTEAAITAVRKLAAAAGHPLPATPIPVAKTGTGGGAGVPLAILIFVCVVLAAAVLTFRRRRVSAASRPR